VANGDAREAFLVLYALFWSIELSSAIRFHAFDTQLWSHPERERKWQSWRRFLASVLTMNLAPLALLAVLYWYVVPADTVGLWGLVVAGVAALSVFGFHRILHFVLLTPRWRSLFYDGAEAAAVLAAWRPRLEDRVEGIAAHLLPGLGYLVVCSGIAFAAARMLPNVPTASGGSANHLAYSGVDWNTMWPAVTAIGTFLAAVAAAIAAYYAASQVRVARFSSGVDMVDRLDVRFESEEYLEKRRTAASALRDLQENDDPTLDGEGRASSRFLRNAGLAGPTQSR
jgi:hypothetical protein